MARAGVPKPQSSLGNVDEIPDPAGTGHLVLPLLHVDAAMSCGAQSALELVMPTGRREMIWPGPQFLPRRGCIGGRLLAQRFPALNGLTRGEPHLPLPSAGRRRHPVPPFCAHLASDRRWRHLPEIFIARR